MPGRAAAPPLCCDGRVATGWQTDAEGDCLTVRVKGELDLDSGPRLREHLAAELAHRDASQLVLDLTDVTFCDSSGLGALVATQRRARLLDRHLVLVLDRHSQLHRLLELTETLGVFDIRDGGWPPR